MADGSLNFDTKLETGSFEQSIDRIESVLKQILAEFKSLTAAIQGVPPVKVEADTTQLDEAEKKVDAVTEAVDELPSETKVDVEVEADPTEVNDTTNAIDNVGAEATKTSAQVSQAFQEASKSASKSVDNSCDGIVKTMTAMLGKVKALAAAAGIGFGIKQIKSFLNTSEEYFKVQFSAEKQLEQIMHNVTGATEEQVKATKEWASALQKVGVIGDEVTLSGLQELGKYVTNTDSLKQLSTAMDDLIAQEYGLSASADNAASTASMLGKALNGQTEILRRNGIIFTDAQEKVLKYGTEQERVAMLAQVIESRVGGMNEALANTPAGRLKQLSNTFGDIREKFGEAYTNLKALLIPALEQVAGLLAQVADLAVRATQALGNIFGISLDNSVAYKNNVLSAVDAQNALTDAVEETEKAQKGSLAAFDQLNTISSNKDESKGAGAATTMSPTVDTKEANKKLDDFAKKVKSVFAKIKSFVQTNFGNTFNYIWEGLKAEGQELLGTFKRIFGDIQTLAEPLKDYFKNNFVPFLDAVFQTAGKILVGLFDTFNKVFADIWDIVVFPYLQMYISVGLPMLTEFATQAVETFGVFFDAVKLGFDTIWEDAAKPVLTFIMKIWQDLMLIFKKFWDKYGAVIFNKLRQAIRNAADVFQTMWKNIFKPIFEKIMEVVDELWDKHMKQFVENVLELVATLIDAGLDIYNKFIAPVAKWFAENFGPPIVETLGVVIEMVSAVLGNVIDAASGIIKYLTGVIEFISGVFTGDWDKAWNGIKKSFEGIWGAFVDIVKVPLNLIIGELNLFINGINQVLNKLVEAFGEIDFDIPSWVPGIGGNSFHIDLSAVHIPSIPYLAQGTVIPANYGNFLAMLGDNKREAEVVSPVSTMKQAMLEALAEAGTAPKEITVYTYLYPNSAAYHREVINIVNEDARNRGV